MNPGNTEPGRAAGNEELPYLLAPASGETVVLFGEVLFDRFPDGAEVLGGAPFNVARHLRAFGLNPVLVSSIGEDGRRERVLEVLQHNRMDPRGVQVDGQHPTGEVLVRLDAGGPEFEIPPRQAFDFVQACQARAALLSTSPRLLYFGTLAQRHSTSRKALETLLKESDAPRLCDLNLRKPWYDESTVERSLEQTDYLKLSEGELKDVARLLHVPEETEMAAQMLLARFRLRQVLVTCGADGARLFSQHGAETRVAASAGPAPVVDSVGAGDAFAAVFIVGTLHRWAPALTLARADAFARAVCGIRGAVPDSEGFYARFREEWEE